jgi:soluble P-type ATPase
VYTETLVQAYRTVVYLQNVLIYKYRYVIDIFVETFYRCGDAYRESMIIKDLNVHGIPDIRFLTFADKTLKLLIVTEVNKTSFHDN